MIVTPTSDLIVDVLQAADPSAQRAATAKLDAMKSAEDDFGVTLDARTAELASGGRASGGLPPTAAGSTDLAGGLPSARVIGGSPPADAYRKFEAFVLQVFVETMLPEGAHDVFGKGLAGGIWRSMLAEQLGNELAKGKGIGIAKVLAAAHPPVQDDETRT
jgi:hypothetical protein